MLFTNESISLYFLYLYITNYSNISLSTFLANDIEEAGASSVSTARLMVVLAINLFPPSIVKGIPAISAISHSDSIISDKSLPLDTNEEAKCRIDLIINQIALKENINENLKSSNFLEWVSAMNNAKSRAEEIVFSELIYI